MMMPENSQPEQPFQCYAAELLWDDDRAQRFRRLMLEATGLPCVCSPGETCPLLELGLAHLTECADRKPVNVRIGRAVADEIELAGLREGIAAMIGMSESRLYRCIRGFEPFLITELAAIAERVGSTVSELLWASEQDAEHA